MKNKINNTELFNYIEKNKSNPSIVTRSKI